MKRNASAVFAAVLFCLTVCTAHAASLNEWAEEMLRLPDVSSDLRPVSVALVDTGVDPSRLDAARIRPGRSYVSETTEDLIGHGTRVASLIIGAEDSGDAIGDIAPNALLVPLVYYSQYPSGVPINGGTEALAQAIYDAVGTFDCRVVCISSGVTQPCEELARAVAYAEEQGAVVLSAAGNEGNDTPYYPAAYPTVIGVGSVGKQGVSSFSQRGEGVMLCAPGEGLYAVSIKNGKFFQQYSGTSYACAYAAACAAQLLGEYPGMTPAQLRWVLQNTSKDLGVPGYDQTFGVGLIQTEISETAYAALSAIEPLPYYDVFARDWFCGSVEYVCQNRLFTGVSDTLFDPGGATTRGMLVTALHRLEGEPQVETSAFSDVPSEAYYAKAAAWASAHDIVKGYDAGTFGPDDPVTREQLAAILRRYADFKGMATDESGDLLVFADASKISGWAKESVIWAVGSELICGKGNGILAPLGNAARAEAAAILQRFLEK